MPTPRYKVEQALADLGLAAPVIASGNWALGNTAPSGGAYSIVTPTIVSNPRGIMVLSGNNIQVKKAGYYFLRGFWNGGSGVEQQVWRIQIQRNAGTIRETAVGLTPWLDGGVDVADLTALCVPGDNLSINLRKDAGTNYTAAGGWTLWFLPTAYYLG